MKLIFFCIFFNENSLSPWNFSFLGYNPSFRNFDNFGPNCKIFAILVLFKFKSILNLWKGLGTIIVHCFTEKYSFGPPEQKISHNGPHWAENVIFSPLSVKFMFFDPLNEYISRNCLTETVLTHLIHQNSWYVNLDPWFFIFHILGPKFVFLAQRKLLLTT